MLLPRLRKHLNADALIFTVRCALARIRDHRSESAKIPLVDALMGAYAMFALKDSSLLQFDRRRRYDPNLKRIFRIGQVPCDTQMRTICDPVDPDALRPAFRAVFRDLQRGKALEPFVFLDGHYLLSLDGTEFYRSTQVGSPACMTAVNQNTGTTTYYQQMIGAVIVHPDHREVIPLVPEILRNTDGQTKNDCERTAIRRWLGKFRQDHPHLPVILTEDALSPNAPHIRALQAHHCRFLLRVKPGDHRFLFDYVEAAHAHGLTTAFERVDPGDPRITHRYRFLDAVPLNQSNLDLLVTFVEYWEHSPERTRHFTWVTDLTVTPQNIPYVVRGGRAHWRVENETFNTLKNQGYHFGHNYGLGHENLSAVFALLMMLAFLVDQTQQLACPLFRAVWRKMGSKKALWEELRWAFKGFLFASMTELYVALLRGIQAKPPDLLPVPDTS